MKRSFFVALLCLILSFAFAAISSAHFAMVILSNDVVGCARERTQTER